MAGVRNTSQENIKRNKGAIDSVSYNLRALKNENEIQAQLRKLPVVPSDDPSNNKVDSGKSS